MGTIIKRGKSYQVQISMYERGKNKRLTKTFKTKRDAKHWEREMEILKGNGTQLMEWTTPFAKFYKEFVHFVKKREVRKSTFHNYERSIKIIKDLFGNIQMRHLNDNIVQSKIDEYAVGRSKRTTNDLLTKIKTALKYAHGCGHIPYDFTHIIKASGYEIDNRNRVLSLAHYEKLKKYLKYNSHHEENIFILTTLQNGLRRSECLGLRLENIYENYIDVKYSISPTSSDTSLKSKSAYRKIPITKEKY